MGRADGESLKTIKPAAPMVEVSALIQENYLVEIEATTILPDQCNRSCLFLLTFLLGNSVGERIARINKTKTKISAAIIYKFFDKDNWEIMIFAM